MKRILSLLTIASLLLVGCGEEDRVKVWKYDEEKGNFVEKHFNPDNTEVDTNPTPDPNATASTETEENPGLYAESEFGKYIELNSSLEVAEYELDGMIIKIQNNIPVNQDVDTESEVLKYLCQINLAGDNGDQGKIVIGKDIKSWSKDDAAKYDRLLNDDYINLGATYDRSLQGTKDGNPLITHIFEFNGGDVKGKQFVLFKDNSVYSFTYTASVNFYDYYLDEFNQLFNDTRFK